MKIMNFARVLVGSVSLLGACSVQTAEQYTTLEGKALLSKEVSEMFDELARPEGACLSGRLGNSQSCESAPDWKQFVADACAARGLQVASISSAESCGADRYRYSEFSCCPTSQVTPAPNCTAGVEGGPSTCQSISAWKDAATSSCVAKGQLVADVYFGESCGAEQVRSVRFQCCGDLPVSSPPEDCQPFTDGNAQTCQSPEDWKKSVAAQCTSKGLQLSDLSLSGDCGAGKFSTTKFLCCGARPTPPPTPTCQSEVYKTPGCKDESAWRQVASDVCTARSLKLGAIGFSDSCGTGSWQNMKYACCSEVTGETPPPPPSSCTWQLLSETAACNDQATWRDLGVRACAASGTRLNELLFGNTCGLGKYDAAKVSCCK